MKKTIFFASIVLAICFLGCPAEVKQDDSDDGAWVLEISGVTGSPGIVGAALMTDLSGEPEYVGLYASASVKFYAYKADATIPMDTTKPLKTAGEYYIALSTSMSADDPNATTYLYFADIQSDQTPSKYQFSQQTSTIAWDKFVDTSSLQP